MLTFCLKCRNWDIWAGLYYWSSFNLKKNKVHISPFFLRHSTSCGSSCSSLSLIFINSRNFRSCAMMRSSSFISVLYDCKSLSAFSFSRIILACASSLMYTQNYTINDVIECIMFSENVIHDTLCWRRRAWKICVQMIYLESYADVDSSMTCPISCFSRCKSLSIFL